MSNPTTTPTTNPTTNPIAELWNALARSPLLRLAVVGALVLCLQIPVLFIDGLVRERSQTRHQAVDDITSKWGRGQQVFGPFLVVPYSYTTLYQRNDSGDEPETPRYETVEHQTTATFLPEDLRIEGDLATDVRHRGIFEAPVYTSSLRIEGRFPQLDFSVWDVEPERIEWERAQLVFEISDVHAIQNRASLVWRGEERFFEPGTGRLRTDRAGIHAAVALAAEAEELGFAAELDLKGSMLFRVAPLGKNTEAVLRADWPDPGFQGAYLPIDPQIAPEGFSAVWRIPHLGRNYPQSWSRTEYAEMVQQSAFGFDLLTPVDAYRQTDRSLKYQLLFLGLTFITIWLFEVLGGAKLHPVQYVLIGGAMCLFYLLELSLAEHLGFVAAYAAAVGLVVGLVYLYARDVFGSSARALSVAGVLAVLYGCLYVLLQIQDYALLVGSLGLFLGLAGIMFVTRKVDWRSAKLPAG